MEILTERSLVSRYSVALIAPAVIAALMEVTWPFFRPSPVSPYFVAIIFCAWYGGLGPGLLSVVVSFLLSDFLFVEPYFLFWPFKEFNLGRVLLFAVVGPFISVMSELMQRETRRAEINLESARQAEEARRQSDANYRALFEGSALPMWVYDSETLAFLAVNEAAVHHYGYSREEFLAMTIVDIRPAEDVPTLHAKLAEAAAGFSAAANSWRHKKKDGSIIDVETTHNPVDFAGRPARLVLANDVTERKRMERAIRSSEESLAQAQEIVHLGSWDWDLLTNRIHWSAEMFRIYGIAREDFGETYEAVKYFNHPDDQERVGQIIEAALRDKQPANFDYKIVRPDGTVRVMNAQLQVYLDEDGRVVKTAGTVQDITERNDAEEALRESEERYRELFENAKDATYVHDLSGRYTSVNRAAEKLSGHSRSDLIGRRFTDFVPPEQIGAITERLCRKLVEDGETTYETEVIGSEGRRVPVEVSSHLIYENGIAMGVQGTARDITERKRAADQLRQAKEFSENLIQTANVIILGLDLEGKVNIFNQTAEEITGYTAAELKGRSWFEMLVPRDRYPYVWDEFRRMVGGGGSPTSFENPLLTKSGEERYIMWQNNQVRVDGKVVAMISFGNDITERKRAEEELRQSEERFSKAFHSSPAALSITLLEDGRLLEVNDAFLRMTGYTRDEVIGKSTTELGLWHSKQRMAMEGLLQERGTVTDLEIIFRDKAGEVREGLLSVEVIELSGKRCVLGIAQDVTERNRAEAALQDYPRQLIEAQETERQTIARELHDQIGQVLTAIRINLQTVWETCAASESRALIDEGVGIVDEALEQVRDLSFELRPSLLDDLGLVAALRWYSDRFARRTGIHSATAIDLRENKTRLRLELETACFRIVQEALTNVVRHARARKVSITLRSLKNEICLSIKDDGGGFDAHSQNPSQFTTHLGLRGMRERALALGGRLEIKSEPRRGTEILAQFPINGNKD